MLLSGAKEKRMKILSSVILEPENALMAEFHLKFFSFSKEIIFFHAEAVTV